MKQNSSKIEYPLGEYACASYGFTGCMHFNYKGRVRILIDKYWFYCFFVLLNDLPSENLNWSNILAIKVVSWEVNRKKL